MIDAAAGLTIDLVARYGVVVLFLVFVLEGALVGKVIPTRTLFVAVVVAMGTSLLDIVPVLAAAVLGATVGQSILFVLVRRREIDLAEIDLIPIDAGQVNRAEGWLDRWGSPAVAVTNVVPLARGSLIVPMALSDTSAYRFSAWSMAGSAVYGGALVGVAIGIESLAALAGLF
ncbi:DedA family protein [Natranaeroarchaeum sulfidigenes]|uniref:Putative membrane-associated protein, DedA family n=1 Tax=Natranaeroarchaeum sulfidigenes TaxID=2784880 RepID=A0A897MQZ2_9EURY|nr:VTT domain-containing protein [Natranaeroarchaeum sulfidigenes]QSG01423.1 putative membrane-associated protein, DedA family [Natranaeroarchaeum sulfidigenes]